MPKYQYTAKDAAGKKKKGQLMAAVKFNCNRGGLF